jgi:hypothetical protein
MSILSGCVLVLHNYDVLGGMLNPFSELVDVSVGVHGFDHGRGCNFDDFRALDNRFQGKRTALRRRAKMPVAWTGVASRWPGFLKMGRTILAAAGFHPESLLFRDARKANWQRGLKETAAVVCDSVTASELPKTFRVVQFPLVSEATLAELRRYEKFIRNPLVPSV